MTSSREVLIEAREVSKRFLLRHNRAGSLKERALGLLVPSLREQVEEFWALRGVSLVVRRGESVGVVGRNGSGKSTLLKLMSGIYLPTSGRLRLRRGVRIGSMIELGTGFNPDLSGRENVFLNASIFGLTRAEIAQRYERIAEFAELRQFMDQPLKNYSSGMAMRLGFAVASQLEPHLLLLDEVFAVGDEPFQQKCVRKMQEFRERGTTTLFVSHSPEAIRANCDRLCVLDKGRLVYDGGVEPGLARYHQLLASLETETAEGLVASGEGPIPTTPEESAAPSERLGRWQFDFLRSRGLEPSHVVLDVGCGDLTAGRFLIPYLDAGHYWGLDHDRLRVEHAIWRDLAPRGIDPYRARFIFNDHFDLDAMTAAPDVAFAHHLLPELPLNSIVRCVASVLERLAPGGRFFATYYETSKPDGLETVRQPDGTVTHLDRPPFHYDFATLARLGESRGACVERLGDRGHPGGQVMLVITKPAEEGA